jgi:uncharacterized DUF497 family protein
MRLIWTPTNLPKLRRHNVTPEEVEECFLDPKNYRRTSGGGRRRPTKREGRRYFLIAQTGAGRYLRVVFEVLPDGVKVVTAFNASGADRDLYWKKR